MSKDIVLSFSVCANGDLLIDVADGHQLVIQESEANRMRVSTVPAVLMQRKLERKDDFEVAAKIGDVMKDGSIYSGISPENNKQFFTVSAEHLKSLGKRKAVEYSRNGEFHGHKDWQLASPEEIAHLYQNQTSGQLHKLLGHKQRHFYMALGKDGEVIIVNTKGDEAKPMSYSLYSIPIRYQFN